MEFNNGLLNINLSDDELDRLLSLDDNNKLVTSTPKKQDFAENDENLFGSIFSRPSQFQISKNVPEFDSERYPTSDICNVQLTEMDRSSECLNLCTKDSNLSQLKIAKTSSLPTNLNNKNMKSRNYSKILSENRNCLSASLNTHFQFSNLSLPESLDTSPNTFTYGLNQSHYNFFKNYTQKSNLSTEQYSLNLSAPSVTDAAPQKDFTQIPLSIMELYQAIGSSYSDFAFVYAISAQMCQEFIPMDCYLNLKMSLLLSITSLAKNRKNDRPIPIVAIGPDSALINRIMLHFGQNLPQRFLAPIDDLQNIGGIINHENMIEAGPALLAKGGICYLGDWYHMKKTQSDKILKEIECGILNIDKTNINYQLQCSIWCYWTGSYKNNAKDKRTLNSFMEIFGVPVMLGDKADGNVLIDFIFEQTVTQSNNIADDELSISLNDMKEYLKIVGNRTVDFTSAALDIMQKYFVASRTDRPDCLTQQSFIILKKYAESFAKLSLRHDVISSDVVASIYLVEYSIQNLFGFGIYPSPQLTTFNNYIGEIDSFMMKFQNWLNDYIKRFN